MFQSGYSIILGRGFFILFLSYAYHLDFHFYIFLYFIHNICKGISFQSLYGMSSYRLMGGGGGHISHFPVTTFLLLVFIC